MNENLIKNYLVKHDENGRVTAVEEVGINTVLPENNYIIVSDLSIFNDNNSHFIFVIDGELKVVVPSTSVKCKLRRSDDNVGFRVIANHAALLLEPDEKYKDIQYYTEHHE